MSGYVDSPARSPEIQWLRSELVREKKPPLPGSVRDHDRIQWLEARLAGFGLVVGGDGKLWAVKK